LRDSFRVFCFRVVASSNTGLNLLTRSGALAVGEELVDRVDQAFDIGLRNEGGGAGRERFAPVNFIGVARVEDARHGGGDRHQCLA
jgi:hypothetical protein